jgi:hypothetical protein
MSSGGPAPPPQPPLAPVPLGMGGGGRGGHHQQDWIHMEYMLQKFFGLLQDELTRSPIYIALIAQGIREFNGGFILMTTNAVNQLYVLMPAGQQLSLLFHHKMMVTALLQFYHMKSRAISKLADLIHSAILWPTLHQKMNFALSFQNSSTVLTVSILQPWPWWFLLLSSPINLQSHLSIFKFEI